MQTALCALKFKLSESLCKVFSSLEMFLKDRNISKTGLYLRTDAWWPGGEKPGEVL